MATNTREVQVKHMNKNTLILESKLLAPCGMYCGFCLHYRKEKKPHCTGCFDKKGHQFWGECRLHACTTKHEVEHCGLCDEFPCSFFVGYYEGAPDNIHGQRDAILRAGLLAYRRKADPEKYLEIVKKLKDCIERF